MPRIRDRIGPVLVAVMLSLISAIAQEPVAPAEAPPLSIEELERVLLQAAAAVDEPPVLGPAERVDALEGFLRSVSKNDAARVPALLLRLMRHSEEGIRITAMNWLVLRYDFGVEAIEKGLMDRSDVVQLAALERLLDRGLDPKSVDDIQEAVKRKDRDGIRVLLLADPKLRR
jgi:hypothetical protein